MELTAARTRLLLLLGLAYTPACLPEASAQPQAPLRLPAPSCAHAQGCIAAAPTPPSAHAPTPYERCAASVGPGLRLDHYSRLGERTREPAQLTTSREASFDADLTREVRSRGGAAANLCCYDWVLGCMGGRPFRPHGEPTLAPTEARTDWLRPPLDLATAELTERERACLAAHWTEAARYEHASVASFARFTLQLLALGAPAALLRDAQQAALEELEHARLCFRLASDFTGTSLGPGALPAAPSEAPPSFASLALETFLDGCVEETFAALAMAEAARGCAHAPTRERLFEVAEQEQRHAELAWRTLAWALREGGDAVHGALERCALPRPASAPSPVEQPALERWGVLSAGRLAALRASVLAEVVRPCLAALLASRGEATLEPAASAL